jgi:hypothetical protein
MWATLTLMSALSMAPGQAGDLQLSNDRVTYGILGPTRADKKFLPGDIYLVTFDMEGLKFEDGLAQYRIKMDLLDAKGNSIFKTFEQDRDLFAVQGGGRVTLNTHAEIKTDTAPGKYTMKLTLTDLKTKKTATLSRDYEVAAKDFGIVRVHCAYDDRGLLPAPPLGVVGQGLFLRFGVAGFGRDEKTKQPKIKLEMRMLDDKGNPTLDKPVSEVVPKSDEPVGAESVLPLWFGLALTRPGKFKVELKATDLVNNKTSSVTYPLTVVEPPTK